MSRPICTGARKDGSACRAPALPDSTLCWVHDPRQAEAAREARAAGASKGAKVKALRGRRRRLDTHEGLTAFLAGVIYDVFDGKVEPDVARTVIYGASVMRYLQDRGAERGIEHRLSEIEGKLGLARKARV